MVMVHWFPSSLHAGLRLKSDSLVQRSATDLWNSGILITLWQQLVSNDMT